MRSDLDGAVAVEQWIVFSIFSQVVVLRPPYLLDASEEQAFAFCRARDFFAVRDTPNNLVMKMATARKALLVGVPASGWAPESRPNDARTCVGRGLGEESAAYVTRVELEGAAGVVVDTDADEDVVEHRGDQVKRVHSSSRCSRVPAQGLRFGPRLKV